MRRRDFLTRAGRAALGFGAAAHLPWLSTCGDHDPLGPCLRSLARGLGALARDLEGRLVLPRDADYAPARLLFYLGFGPGRWPWTCLTQA